MHTHAHTNSHRKLQKDTLQVERNPKRQLKDFLLEAYVLFMRYVWGPWLRKMTFYLLHPAALENVIICLDSEEFFGL